MDHQVTRSLEGLVAVDERTDEVEFHLARLVWLEHLHSTLRELLPFLLMNLHYFYRNNGRHAAEQSLLQKGHFVPLSSAESGHVLLR